jgi:ADP-dependent NAD(P)H-hydrate dehydratase
MSADHIDLPWRQRNPLPPIAGHGDKASRGHLLAIGGSTLSPGSIRLTAEAALRVGAGRVRIATVEATAIALGVQVPEAGVLALPADDVGEIAANAVETLGVRLAEASVLAVGPGMRLRDHTPDLVAAVVEGANPDALFLLDAAALLAFERCSIAPERIAGRLVLTPHPGELATLLGAEQDDVLADMTGYAARAADRYGAVVVLGSTRTVIAAPGGTVLHYASDSPGLGTPGSGDVLAGTIGGLLARGASPLVASAWGAWLHGEAGLVAARSYGPLGFLARDLLVELPRLMASQG